MMSAKHSAGYIGFVFICMVVGLLVGGYQYFKDANSSSGFDRDNGHQIFSAPGTVYGFNIMTDVFSLNGDWEANDLALIFDTPTGDWKIKVPPHTQEHWGPYSTITQASPVWVSGSLTVPTDYQTLPLVLRGRLQGEITYAGRSNGWQQFETTLDLPVELNIMSVADLKANASDTAILWRNLGLGLGGGLLIGLVLLGGMKSR